MADSGIAGEALDHLAAGEGVADEAETTLGMETAAVIGDDAGRFLAAVLQGVEAERGDRRGIGMTEDAKNAALLAQPVRIQVQRRVGCLSHRSSQWEPLLGAGSRGRGRRATVGFLARRVGLLVFRFGLFQPL